MELELKHLVGYLPYGLKLNFVSDRMVDRLSVKDIVLLKTIDEGIIVVNGYKTNNKSYLPILRPLSDLIKEIEVNGEKFVPHLELGGRPNLKDYDFVYFKKNIENLSFGLIQQLLEWHFDIYGLIENNLAIDINALNNDN